MKGLKNFKLKNYLNTIYSKSHNIHEFHNVHALLGIKDVVCGLVDKNFLRNYKKSYIFDHFIPCMRI